MSDVSSASFAFAADQACWGAAVRSVRHYAILQGLDVGFVDRSGELVSLTVSGPPAILAPFMRRIEAAFGEAVRPSPAPREGVENFHTFPASLTPAGSDHG